MDIETFVKNKQVAIEKSFQNQYKNFKETTGMTLEEAIDTLLEQESNDPYEENPIELYDSFYALSWRDDLNFCKLFISNYLKKRGFGVEWVKKDQEVLRIHWI